MNKSEPQRKRSRIITKIAVQKRKSDRLSIFVDEKYEFSLSANDLIKQKIAKGDEITTERLNELKNLAAKSLLYSKAIDYIAIRPRSEKEMRDHFFRKKQSKESIGEVIKYLKIKGLLNDQKFAEWFTTQRIRSYNPKGKRAIYAELMKKGISGNTVRHAIGNIEENTEYENALKLAQRKLKRFMKKDPTDVKQKTIQYLSSRGYDWPTIRRTIDSIHTQT